MGLPLRSRRRAQATLGPQIRRTWLGVTSPSKPPRREPQRGVVMVIVLLALVLLAGLVFYVFNVGRAVQTRQQTQHAADAAVAAGAGTLARSLNTVAMNNTESARLTALSATLDAAPRATAMTLADQKAMQEALRRQLTRAIPDYWVRDQLDEAYTEVGKEVQALTPMDQLLNRSSFDMRKVTYYNAPDGDRGEIWQAMEGLEAMSLATMDTLSFRVQAAADDGGAVDLGRDVKRAGALVLPLTVQVPWRHGDFDDFRRPVQDGLLPRDIDNKRTNRGPYDTIFGWRFPIGGTREHTRGTSDPSGGRGNVPIGRGAGGGGGRGKTTLISLKPNAYGVGGPGGWMTDRLYDMAAANLPLSRFGLHNARLTHIKYGYLWDNASQNQTTIIAPKWITNFAQATGTEPDKIKETAFIAVEIKSTVSPKSSRFGAPGTWSYVGHYDLYGRYRLGARPLWISGWEDPRKWDVPKVSSYIWRDTWSYDVTYDSDLGIPPDPKNPAKRTKVYRVDNYMFVGVNVGEEVEVRDPYNFTDRSALPGPVELDRQSGTDLGPDEAGRRENLTLLGIARRGADSALWPHAFDKQRAYPNHVALAQAQVFNNHSWDLWTQMWTAQLVPIDRYGDWIDQLSATDAAAQMTGQDAGQLADLHQYLRSTEDLAAMTLSH